MNLIFLNQKYLQIDFILIEYKHEQEETLKQLETIRKLDLMVHIKRFDK